jgi:hypothetical protein
MRRHRLLAAAVVATAVAVATPGASAEPRQGVTPHFRGPVAVGGLCDEQAAYHAVLRQNHDNVVARVRMRHAGVHSRWDYSSKVRTDFGDGSGVVGSGDGSVRADANGHFTLVGETPVGARHEFTFHLRRADTGERCYIKVKA